MKYRTNALVSLGMISLLCYSTTIGNQRPRLLIDRIADVAIAGTLSSNAALELLQQVALGRLEDIDSESLARIELLPVGTPQRKAAFIGASIRAYAFQKIGEVGLEESMIFLSTLKQADIGPDTTGEMWPAAQIALASVRLSRIADPQSKIEFLEGLLNPRVPASSWAVDQLCDRGSVMSMRVIRPYIGRVLSGQPGEEDIQFCEGRMQIVSSSSDRARALGSVLNVNSAPETDRLIRWAMGQLGEMDSPAAEAELVRFKNEMKTIPKGDSRLVRFSGFDSGIDYHLERIAHKQKQPVRSQIKR